MQSTIALLKNCCLRICKINVFHSNAYIQVTENASYLFPCKLQQIQRDQSHCLIEQIVSTKQYFSTVVTIGKMFSLAMNESLHAVLIKFCISGDDLLFHSCYDSILIGVHCSSLHCAHILRCLVSTNVQRNDSYLEMWTLLGDDQ